MTVNSMTGFARSDGQSAIFGWVWEVRSVNGRGLDLRFRPPPGMEMLEPVIRSAATARFQRGNVSVSLQLAQNATQPTLRVNRPLLDEIVALARDLEGEITAAAPRLDGLLAIRGVIEVASPEESDDEKSERETAMVASLERAFDALAAARAEEGRRLAVVLGEQIDEIAALVGAAAETAACQPAAIRERLARLVGELLTAEPALPADRLAAEAAVLATKADVREELDRLRSHIEQARELMAAKNGEAVGRRLEFLAQEFNREANTLCSKSTDIELTRVGLDLKAVIDRFREQVQNIE